MAVKGATYLETIKESGYLLGPEKIRGVKMPDLDQEENFEEWSDLFLRIRWHSCYINSTYYEVELFDDSFIRFKYEGNTLKEKPLSKFEENAIRKLLKKLKFEVLRQVKESQIRMTPDVPLKLSLRTRTTYLELHWHSSDEENYPENFNNFEKLARSIEEMIDVDKSELLLPIYE
jgi:hypothetical protein